MQGLRRYGNEVGQLDLVPTQSPPSSSTSSLSGGSNSLSIDVAESAETRIRRLISENPVIIFSRSSCCMCHVMKKLLATIGVHPTVIELDDNEIDALQPSASYSSSHAALDNNLLSNPAPPPPPQTPLVFIGGAFVGGLESLVALHLSGHLVPKLVEVGALWV